MLGAYGDPANNLVNLYIIPAIIGFGSSTSNTNSHKSSSETTIFKTTEVSSDFLGAITALVVLSTLIILTRSRSKKTLNPLSS